jgi:hypothetical protein
MPNCLNPATLFTPAEKFGAFLPSGSLLNKRRSDQLAGSGKWVAHLISRRPGFVSAP